MIDELADLLLGARCPGCSRPGAGLCAICHAALQGPPRRVDDAVALAGLECWSAGGYGAVARELLSAHKDRGALALTPVLGARLAVAVAAVAPSSGVLLLVPVPSTPRAVRERGLDHASALARSAAGALRRAGAPGPVRVARPLRRVGAVADQSSLGRRQRLANQHRSMGSSPCPPSLARGCRVVLVDDICTTGASLAEAARALREGGWPVVAAAVVAHPCDMRVNLV